MGALLRTLVGPEGRTDLEYNARRSAGGARQSTKALGPER
jgi:hypothetical protein